MQLFSVKSGHHCLHESISRQGFSIQPQVSGMIKNELGEIVCLKSSASCFIEIWRRGRPSVGDVLCSIVEYQDI